MRWLLPAAILAAAAGPAAACLNDATLKGSEREFRSQYQSAPPAPAGPPVTSGADREYRLRGIVGGVLVVAAVALTLRRPAA